MIRPEKAFSFASAWKCIVTAEGNQGWLAF
jgi:hypothetical protein